MSFRYRPKGNRTPVNDPVLGHLEYDGVYDDPRCADDPRFEEIAEPASDKPSAESDQPAAKTQADAGKTGRSKQ